MLFSSTNDALMRVSLREAVFNGTAPDGALYMPVSIPQLPGALIDNLSTLDLQQVGYVVLSTLLGDSITLAALKAMVDDTLSFDIPVVPVATRPGMHVMELFHGPTMCFKDVGARFMARLLGHLRRGMSSALGTLNVLVASSGDTGSAVANGFRDVKGVRVIVLYPKGVVNYIQEAQFATLGSNVVAVEVNGTFDDCKRLVEQAFADVPLRHRISLTSATSVNIARLLPQVVYYFHAVAELQRSGVDTGGGVAFAVPCANLGNLAAGLLAWRMGLPVKRFLAVENQNNIFYRYMTTGVFEPRPSLASIAPALDAGNPGNFARVAALTGSLEQARRIVEPHCCDDTAIVDTMRTAWTRDHYLIDPNTAVAYGAADRHLQPGVPTIVLATAHAAKLKRTVEQVLGTELALPRQLARFLEGRRHVETLPSGYTAFRRFLLALP